MPYGTEGDNGGELRMIDRKALQEKRSAPDSFAMRAETGKPEDRFRRKREGLCESDRDEALAQAEQNKNKAAAVS